MKPEDPNKFGEPKELGPSKRQLWSQVTGFGDHKDPLNPKPQFTRPLIFRRSRWLSSNGKLVGAAKKHRAHVKQLHQTPNHLQERGAGP